MAKNRDEKAKENPATDGAKKLCEAIFGNAPFDECCLCNKPLGYGEAIVSVNCNVEQIEHDEERDLDEVTTVRSDLLFNLCASCGSVDVNLLREHLEKALKDHVQPPP